MSLQKTSLRYLKFALEYLTKLGKRWSLTLTKKYRSLINDLPLRGEGGLNIRSSNVKLRYNTFTEQVEVKIN